MGLPHLLDVSNWQGPVDWRAEKRSGVEYVYCKVSQGLTYTDPTGARRIRNARYAGLHPGGYHFATPGVGAPEAQADRLLSLAPLTPGSLRPCLDAETNPLGLNAAQLATWYLGFVLRVVKRTGLHPTIYGPPSYLQAWPLYHPEVFGRCPLWIAAYGVKHPPVPAPWSHWTAWQWTDAKLSSPARGRVDDSFVAAPGELLIPWRRPHLAAAAALRRSGR